MYFKQGLNSMMQESAVDPVQEEVLSEKVEEYEGDGLIDVNALFETYVVDYVNSMPDEQRQAFLESDTFQALVEAGGIKHRAIVRMSKQADLDRRINLAAIQKAKEKGDADWEALRKNRVNERRLLDRIYKKYGNAVRRDAQIAQKRLINLNPQAFNMMRAIR